MKSDIAEDIIAEALRSVEKHRRRNAGEDSDGEDGVSQQEETEEIIIDPNVLFESSESEDDVTISPLPTPPLVTSAGDDAREEKDGSSGQTESKRKKRRISMAFVQKLRDRIKVLMQEQSELEAALEEKEREAHRHYEMALRASADLENLKKRTAREKRDLEAFGIEKFLRELLPVVDNLERALHHAEKEAKLEVLLEGVRMTLVQLSDCLNKFHVTRIESDVGVPFDPAVHEAMWEEETTEVPPNTIARVVLPGYLLHDRLLRASLVSVARAPAEASAGKSVGGNGPAEVSAREEAEGAPSEEVLDADDSAAQTLKGATDDAGMEGEVSEAGDDGDAPGPGTDADGGAAAEVVDT